jgi:hypothetical protein
MIENCKKCGNELQQGWVVCPYCKEKVKKQKEIVLDKPGKKTKKTPEITTDNEYFKERVERLKSLKVRTRPFNDQWFTPTCLAGIILYIFTTLVFAPTFGFVLPFIFVIVVIFSVFSIAHVVVSLKLKKTQKILA